MPHALQYMAIPTTKGKYRIPYSSVLSSVSSEYSVAVGGSPKPGVAFDVTLCRMCVVSGVSPLKAVLLIRICTPPFDIISRVIYYNKQQQKSRPRPSVSQSVSQPHTPTPTCLIYTLPVLASNSLTVRRDGSTTSAIARQHELQHAMTFRDVPATARLCRCCTVVRHGDDP